MKEDKLIIFLLLRTDIWRAHGDQVYKYVDGYWCGKHVLDIESFIEITTTEGILISFAENDQL